MGIRVWGFRDYAPSSQEIAGRVRLPISAELAFGRLRCPSAARPQWQHTKLRTVGFKYTLFRFWGELLWPPTRSPWTTVCVEGLGFRVYRFRDV